MKRSCSTLVLALLITLSCELGAQKITRWILYGRGWADVERGNASAVKFESEKVTIEVAAPSAQFGLPFVALLVRNTSPAGVIVKVSRIYLKVDAAPGQGAAGAEQATVPASHSFSTPETVPPGAFSSKNIYFNNAWFRSRRTQSDFQLLMEGMEIDGENVPVPVLKLTRTETDLDTGGKKR